MQSGLGSEEGELERKMNRKYDLFKTKSMGN